MASQPANTDINVYRRVRSFRQDHRHESVEALIKHLRPLVMSVPSEEILSGVQNRDTNLADFSAYMGEARHNATRGFPIIIGLNEVKTFADAQEGITGVDFGFTIGRDSFLHHAQASLASRDLHSDLRDDAQVAPQ